MTQKRAVLKCSLSLCSHLTKNTQCPDLKKPVKQLQLITHREDILSQVYRNHANPDMTSCYHGNLSNFILWNVCPIFNPNIMSLAVHTHQSSKHTEHKHGILHKVSKLQDIIIWDSLQYKCINTCQVMKHACVDALQDCSDDWMPYYI
jgi:hypothetical protein